MKKILAAAGMAVLLTAAAATVTYAKPASGQAEKINVFTTGNITTTLEEKLDASGMKKEPYVVNTGSCACRVRIRLEISPENTPVSLDISSGWTQEKDGFYYYKETIEPGEKTTPLFTKCQWMGKEDYSDFEPFEITLYQEAAKRWEYYEE